MKRTTGPVLKMTPSKDPIGGVLVPTYTYFRTYAKSLGCEVDKACDLDVWLFIMIRQQR